MEETQQAGSDRVQHEAVNGKPDSHPDVEYLNRAFKYHAPSGDQPQRYETLRATARELACEILLHSKPSRERSLALSKLEESVMWANAGIARNG